MSDTIEKEPRNVYSCVSKNSTNVTIIFECDSENDITHFEYALSAPFPQGTGYELVAGGYITRDNYIHLCCWIAPCRYNIIGYLEIATQTIVNNIIIIVVILLLVYHTGNNQRNEKDS